MAMTVASSELGSTVRGPHDGAFRPPAIGVRGVVSSAHDLASQAGVRALMLGGNAVDAAVAVAATLAVVEPFMSGLGGGGGFMLIHDGKTGQVHGLDYLGRAPRAARGDVWSRPGGRLQRRPLHHASRAPVAGWLAALERFGKLDRATVFGFAIEVAERGWPISAFAATACWSAAEERLARFASSRAAYLPERPGAARRRDRAAARDGPEPTGRSPRAAPRSSIAATLGERDRPGDPGGRRLADDGGSGRLPGAVGRAAGDRVSRQHRDDDAAAVLRPPVPRIDEDPRGVRPGGARAQLGRVPPPAAGDDQARQRRPHPLYTMDRAWTIRSAARSRVRRRAPRPDRPRARRRRARASATCQNKDGLVAAGDPSRYQRDHTTHFEAADGRGQPRLGHPEQRRRRSAAASWRATPASRC